MFIFDLSTRHCVKDFVHLPRHYCTLSFACLTRRSVPSILDLHERFRALRAMGARTSFARWTQARCCALHLCKMCPTTKKFQRETSAFMITFAKIFYGLHNCRQCQNRSAAICYESVHCQCLPQIFSLRPDNDRRNCADCGQLIIVRVSKMYYNSKKYISTAPAASEPSQTRPSNLRRRPWSTDPRNS